jgi:hypothetical protein
MRTRRWRRTLKTRAHKRVRRVIAPARAGACIPTSCPRKAGRRHSQIDGFNTHSERLRAPGRARESPTGASGGTASGPVAGAAARPQAPKVCAGSGVGCVARCDMMLAQVWALRCMMVDTQACPAPGRQSSRISKQFISRTPLRAQAQSPSPNERNRETKPPPRKRAAAKVTVICRGPERIQSQYCVRPLTSHKYWKHACMHGMLRPPQ